MKNIYSNIIKFNSKNLIKIINILKKDGIIGLPTETVYGLAGNAYSYSAINKILDKIEKGETNLENHTDDYDKLLKLNKHMDDLFKKTLKEINSLGKKNAKK